MILVTGATGFVGSALVRRLAAMGKPVRILLRPSSQSPNIPRSVPVEVAVASLNDERGLRAAMKGVTAIYHLIGTERYGSRANLNGVDIAGTQALVQAASLAGVKRFFFMSHLGADRASAYPVMKTKGIAEGIIQNSGVPYTIFRSAAVFGPDDQFTTQIMRLLKVYPFFFILPAGGTALLQPLWIEDLVTCLSWALDDSQTINQVYPIGGCEYLTYREVIQIILHKTSIKRTLFSVSPPFLRMTTLFAEQVLRGFPISIFWLDYLATDRTCAIDSLPRLMGLMPARFSQQIDFLLK
ncbi:MAG TPA: NAD(P)H-binding protein [Longilinea sp.]|nr:NAD(P)H-binding protein [Longilinea sp.]